MTSPRASVAMVATVCAAVGWAVTVVAGPAAHAGPCVDTGSAGSVCPAPAPGAIAVRPGDEIQTDDEICSVGLTGTIGGAQYAVTAGHCFERGARVYDAAGRAVGVFEFGLPDGPRLGDRTGYALIRLDDGVYPSGAFGGYRVAPAGSNPWPGTTICKLGQRTGATCGRVAAVEGGDLLVEGLHADNGDSGGVVYTRTPDGRAAFAGIVVATLPGTDLDDVESAGQLLDQLRAYAHTRSATFAYYQGF